MWRAPRSCTYTSSSGQRSTSEPLAPAWSRWMWVSSSARGRSPPSPSSSVGRHEVGPGSITTSSTSQEPITRGHAQVHHVDQPHAGRCAGLACVGSDSARRSVVGLDAPAGIGVGSTSWSALLGEDVLGLDILVELESSSLGPSLDGHRSASASVVRRRGRRRRRQPRRGKRSAAESVSVSSSCASSRVSSTIRWRSDQIRSVSASSSRTRSSAALTIWAASRRAASSRSSASLRDCDGDLAGRVVGALEDPRHLLADPLERSADRRVGRAGRLQLGDELARLLHVGVDGEPVVPAQRGREVDVGHGRNGVVGQRRERRGDLLHQRVFGGGRALIGHGADHTRVNPPARQLCRLRSKDLIQSDPMPEPPSHRLPEPDRPWMMRTYAGPLRRPALQRAVPQEPREGPDRAVDRVRPADPDRL